MCTLHLKPLTILSVLIVSLILAGGCKEDSSTGPQQGEKPTIVSFTADPTTVPAGGDSVKLTWNVNNATGLSISPGPGTVTPADSGSVTVFVGSATTFTLTATNSFGSATSTAQVNVALSITVHGYVKDVDGEVISGITVLVKGKSPTTTSADGSFTIPDVETPYEIRIIYSTQQTAIVYQGLTRSDPVLLYLGSTTISKSASISGSVPAAAGKITKVYFISGTKSWWTVADPGTGAYTIDASWKGSVNSFSGSLEVLRWTTNPAGLPDQYDAYGSKDLTISQGGSFTNNNFIETDFTDPAELNINGSIVLPTSSYEITLKQLCINFGNAFVYIAAESGAGLTDNFSYTVPSITGATFEIDVTASVSAFPSSRTTTYQKKGIAGGSSGLSITLAAAPQLNLPVNNGTNVDTTTQFLWTQGGGNGINLVEILPTGVGPVYFIFTSASSTTIPNLGPQGLGLPLNAFYIWMTARFFPISSIDDAASDFFVPLINGQGGETGHSFSESFNFTTHP